MNPLELPRPRFACFTRLAALAAACAVGFAQPLRAADALPTCPMPGWSEGLAAYLTPNAQFPVDDTARMPTPDCNFHEWSWEAFAWATALDAKTGVPRFMTLKSPDDLFVQITPLQPPATKVPKLKLGHRAVASVKTAAGTFTEAAGAIVEADGNMLVSPNGYPIYASVHMNDSYFNTVKKNLIVTGDYEKNPDSDYFEVGAAVFKATWLRLDPGQPAPAGAFTTQAEVPVLSVQTVNGASVVAPSGKFTTVTVALVGLHVVGYTVNHPEFLWGTFEHKDNSPKFPDNTFDPSSTASDPKTYTFYQGGTPWNQVNYNQGNQAAPFLLSFNAATQKFTTLTVPNNLSNGSYSGTSPSTSPGTNVVLANETGSETNSPSGPANIKALNQSAQGFYAGLKTPQTTFSNYFLVGTVWMAPNTYVATNPNALTLDNTDAFGSVNLANTTAETFFQVPHVAPSNAVPSATGSTMQNCFLCHNPTSFNFQKPPPKKLVSRRIALSHVLAANSPYAVQNQITVQSPAPQTAPTLKAPQPTRK